MTSSRARVLVVCRRFSTDGELPRTERAARGKLSAQSMSEEQVAFVPPHRDHARPPSVGQQFDALYERSRDRLARPARSGDTVRKSSATSPRGRGRERAGPLSDSTLSGRARVAATSLQDGRPGLLRSPRRPRWRPARVPCKSAAPARVVSTRGPVPGPDALGRTSRPQ